jgi:hypothetical protein
MEQEPPRVNRETRHLFVKHNYSCSLDRGVHIKYHLLRYYVVTLPQLQVLRQQGSVRVFPCGCNTDLPYSEELTIDSRIVSFSSQSQLVPDPPPRHNALSVPPTQPRPPVLQDIGAVNHQVRTHDFDPDQYAIYASRTAAGPNPPNN